MLIEHLRSWLISNGSYRLSQTYVDEIGNFVKFPEEIENNSRKQSDKRRQQIASIISIDRNKFLECFYDFYNAENYATLTGAFNYYSVTFDGLKNLLSLLRLFVINALNEIVTNSININLKM